MQRASSPRGRRRILPFFLTGLGVVFLDQLTKWWISSNLGIGQVLFEAGVFKIVRIPPNPGAAFGIFPGLSYALAVFSFIGVVLILLYGLFVHHRLFPSGGLVGWIALGLILGGTIGNLIDRSRFGAVTDFISLGWWPAFNIADSAIVVGAILIGCLLLGLAKGHG